MIKELQLLFTQRNRLKDLFQVFIPISPSDVHANSYSHRGARGGGRGAVLDGTPPRCFFISCSILKRFYLQWKACDLLNKMRYILGVVALLEARDVNNSGRHLGFYQELEIRLKLQKRYFFCALHDFSHKIYFYCRKKLKTNVFSPKIGLSTCFL